MIENTDNRIDLGTKSLNSLKFIDAFVIAFIFHYPSFTNIQSHPLKIVFPFACSYGYLMVEMFFVLSGFGMHVGYAKKILNKEISFSSFLKKRFFKIYPLFFFALMVVVLLNHFRGGGSTLIFGTLF